MSLSIVNIVIINILKCNICREYSLFVDVKDSSEIYESIYIAQVCVPRFYIADLIKNNMKRLTIKQNVLTMAVLQYTWSMQ